MWVRKLLYIILILITSYIALMYDGNVPGMLLAFEILLPILLFALTFYQRANISIAFGSIAQVADCDESIKLPIQFKNKGFLPVTDAMLRVTVSNCLDGEEEEYDVNLRAPAKTDVTLPFTFCSTYCGMITVKLGTLKIYDYLRLFCRKKKVSGKTECMIMPHLLDLQLAVTDECRSYDSDSDEYDKHRAGDDPAEIYQIREFRQGDKMSRVHWKMSARLDEIMIKELSRPISNSVGIYLDLRYNDIDEIQAVYDICYSLSAALLFNECHHRIIWYRNGSNGCFEQHLIRNSDDLTETMSKLLSTAKRTDRLYWDEFCKTAESKLYRVVAISCMGNSADMEGFMEADGRVKSVLTIDQIRDLIEI